MDNFLKSIKEDNLKQFINSVHINPLYLSHRSDDLNVYQIAAITGATKILGFLHDEGYDFLGDELDDVPFQFFLYYLNQFEF